jgi:hypothetical protein
MAKEKTQLFNNSEIAKHFGIPQQNIYNWSRSKDWRKAFHNRLDKIMARDIADQAKEMMEKQI